MVFFVIVPNLMDHFHHMPHTGWKDSKKKSHFHDNWAFFNADRRSIFTFRWKRKDKMINQELFESVYNAEYITDNQYFVNDVTSEIV